jgi:hypothetical protein
VRGGGPEVTEGARVKECGPWHRSTRYVIAVPICLRGLCPDIICVSCDTERVAPRTRPDCNWRQPQPKRGCFGFVIIHPQGEARRLSKKDGPWKTPMQKLIITRSIQVFRMDKPTESIVAKSGNG